MDIDVLYEKNIIYYNNDADCIVGAWLLKNYLKNKIGNTPITFKMESGDRYRLEELDEKVTIWIIGLPINDEDMEFINRYSSKVKWFFNNNGLIKTTLTNYDIYNNIDMYSYFIHNKYYTVENKFIDSFIEHYDYYKMIINNISEVEQLYDNEIVEDGEISLYERIKDRLINNVIVNSYKKEYEDYVYFLIYNNCCNDVIVEKILKVWDAVIVTYTITKMNTINYKVYSNVYDLEALCNNVEGTISSNIITSKTDTINTLFLDIPNML